MSPHSPTKYQVHSGPPGVAYEYLYLASSGVTYDEEENVRNEKDHSETDVPFCKLPPGTKFPVEYVDMKIRHSFVPNYENEIPYFKNRKCGRDGSGGFEEDDERIYRLSSDGSSAYENVPRLLGRRSPANMKVSQNSRVSIIDHRESGDGNKVAKPNSLELQVKKRIWDDHSNNITRGPPTDDAYPLSPSGYQQPPTPDFPPPSPGTAETGIHEKMRPLSKVIIAPYVTLKLRTEDVSNGTPDPAGVSFLELIMQKILSFFTCCLRLERLGGKNVATG